MSVPETTLSEMIENVLIAAKAVAEEESTEYYEEVVTSLEQALACAERAEKVQA